MQILVRSYNLHSVRIAVTLNRTHEDVDERCRRYRLTVSYSHVEG